MRVPRLSLCLLSPVMDVDEPSLRDGIGREVIKWTGHPVARVRRSCARVFH